MVAGGVNTLALHMMSAELIILPLAPIDHSWHVTRLNSRGGWWGVPFIRRQSLKSRKAVDTWQTLVVVIVALGRRWRWMQTVTVG